MPRYRFTGPFETVLHGLQHSADVILHRTGPKGGVQDHGQPDGSTVVIQPGDELETPEAYEHPDLVDVDDTPPPTRPSKPRSKSTDTGSE